MEKAEFVETEKGVLVWESKSGTFYSEMQFRLVWVSRLYTAELVI